MQPNQNGLPDGYDFLSDKPKAKRSLLPTGNSKKQRLFVVAGGALLLIILIFVVGGVISNANRPKTELILTVVQEQHELARIADIGTTKGKSSETKNFAASVRSIVRSDQAVLIPLLGKAGIKANEKLLRGKQTTKTDTALTNAEQSGRLDETVTELLQTQLKTYQQDLKKAYDGNSGVKTRAALDKAYANSLLILSPPEEDNTRDQPAKTEAAPTTP